MRLGLFGGTFDPIHEGHLAVGRAALAEAQLERLLYIPNRLPPHKVASTGAAYEHRLRMVELAIVGEPRMQVCDVENRKGKSYTIQTLHHLRTTYGETTQFTFVIGADAFAEVLLWYRVQEVFALTDFLVVSRPGFRYSVPEGARVKALDGLAHRVSSTELRAQLAAGNMPPGISLAVAGYIRSNGLYRNS